MELLNLNIGFTQKEFKSNYKKLMMNIYPDTLGNLNPITRKIIEEEAKKVNIAKSVIESFLKGTFSEYDINTNNNHYKKDTEQNEIEIKKRKITLLLNVIFLNLKSYVKYAKLIISFGRL